MAFLYLAIHSDGYKKSISGPGAGNYLTVGKTFNEIKKHFSSAALNKTFALSASPWEDQHSSKQGK